MANIDYLVLAILLFIFLILVTRKILSLIKYRHYAKIEKLINRFSREPLKFEQFVATLFSAMGYKTELTKGSGDGGKDIIMTKGRHKYAVEVKLYKQDHKVDRERIQKLHSAMIDIDADRGIFVTTSDFTEPAYDYADKYYITTINGTELSKLMKKLHF
ncbi:MAG: restriction endonuclease [Bacillota bacterium]|nr:restriction endonuclease [Bacillota bacterium]